MTTPLAGTLQGYLALSAQPAVCDLVADPRMALVVDRTGERTLWLNAAAARFCRVERPFDAAPSARLNAVRAALADHVQARYVPRQGLVRLRVFLDFRPVWLMCRIDPISLPGGEPGLLALVEDPVPSGLEKLQARIEAVCRLVAHDGLAFVADSGNGIAASAGDESLAEVAGGLEAVVRAVRGDGAVFRAGFARPVTLDLPGVGLTLFVMTRGEDADTPDEATVAEPEPIAAAEPVAAAEPARPAMRPRRFSWQSDAHGRFGFLSHELSEVVGVPAEALRGRTLAEIAAAYGLVGADAVIEAFASHATWSGFSVRWPRADGSLVPIDLAGLSVYEADGAFKGFRGFGVIRFTGAAATAVSPAAERRPPAAPVATPAMEVPVESVVTSAMEPTMAAMPAATEPAAAPQSPDAPPRQPVRETEPELRVEPGRDAHLSGDAEAGEDAGAQEAAEAAATTDSDFMTDGLWSDAAEEAGFETGIFALGAFEHGVFARRPLDLTGADAPAFDLDEPVDIVSAEIPAADAVAGEPVFIDPETDAVFPDPVEPSAGAGDAAVSEATAPLMPAAPDPERPSPKVVPMPGLATPPPEPSGTALSRPEWEAFRLIAAALGARFEGDDAEAEAEADEPETLYPLGEPAISPVGRLAANDSGIVEVDTRILDRLPLGLVACRGAAIIYANPAALMLAGYPDLAGLDAAGGLEGLFAERSEPEGERPVTIRRGDGRLVEVDARMHSVPWGAGRALLVALQSRGEFQAAAPAAPAPSDAAEVFDAIADAVVVVDRAAAIVSLNRAAERLFGRSRAALAGESLMRLVDPDSHRALRAGIAAVIDSVIPTNAGRDIEIVGLAAEGDEIPLQVGFGRYGAGVGARACLTLRDVTPWKRGEAAMAAMARAAERASAQKSDFLARITHEIRTPLNAILGFAEVMLEERLGPIGTPRYRDYLGDIHASGGHILSLVNDLLNLARIEAGKAELDLRPVALDQAVRDCVALMQPQASAERVIVRTSLGSQLPAVLADARSIKQIVLNLLSNAIKFNMIGGQVIVSTTRDESGGVVLRFRDTGIGMAEADIPAALEPFRRLHPTHHEGTGLGLPLTKALAEANGATFAIESAPNQGTLVEIRFPAARLAAE
ncbi:ATP-binding protein [Segnochrobactrum spirostomi]|uniref:histidine kinase n=1 Tax=Segnochrobactrum spirostomi TaxID=2608987 RepID=A0A6A7Y2U2_9HYPH|nr:ATP-binding protein [Segnochrobactrum spirostomi]MQT13403.1 PAS domain-containing protein [Segnochrobactrum spirostomi]